MIEWIRVESYTKIADERRQWRKIKCWYRKSFWNLLERMWCLIPTWFMVILWSDMYFAHSCTFLSRSSKYSDFEFFQIDFGNYDEKRRKARLDLSAIVSDPFQPCGINLHPKRLFIEQFMCPIASKSIAARPCRALSAVEITSTYLPFNSTPALLSRSWRNALDSFN